MNYEFELQDERPSQVCIQKFTFIFLKVKFWKLSQNENVCYLIHKHTYN